MTTIVIDGDFLGRTKGELIDLAFARCGLSAAEFTIEPEETITGLRELNAMMAEWDADGLVLGYNHPDYLDGNAAERSGIAPANEAAVIGSLALRVAPQIGKTLSPETRADINASYRALLNRFAAIPALVQAPHNPRGSGYRRRTLFINES